MKVAFSVIFGSFFVSGCVYPNFNHNPIYYPPALKPVQYKYTVVDSKVVTDIENYGGLLSGLYDRNTSYESCRLVIKKHNEGIE